MSGDTSKAGITIATQWMENKASILSHLSRVNDKSDTGKLYPVNAKGIGISYMWHLIQERPSIRRSW